MKWMFSVLTQQIPGQQPTDGLDSSRDKGINSAESVVSDIWVCRVSIVVYPICKSPKCPRFFIVERVLMVYARGAHLLVCFLFVVVFFNTVTFSTPIEQRTVFQRTEWVLASRDKRNDEPFPVVSSASVCFNNYRWCVCIVFDVLWLDKAHKVFKTQRFSSSFIHNSAMYKNKFSGTIPEEFGNLSLVGAMWVQTLLRLINVCVDKCCFLLSTST
jgi:hypothetical protein